MDKRRRHDRDQETRDETAPAVRHGAPGDDESTVSAARRLVEGQAAKLSGETAGPFRPEINEALSQSFGAGVSGLSASFGEVEVTGALGAKAYTQGSRMVFGPTVTEDLGDVRSMEVIGHEVAHALGGAGARGGIGRADGPSETAATGTGRRFAEWTSGGGKDVPALQPAPGEAGIHCMSVGGPGGLKDPVHEELTLQTLVRAGLVPPDARLWDPETIEYLRGVYWNDDPESLLFRNAPPDDAAGVQFATGTRWLLRFLFGDKERNTTARSHHGDLQFLHAMAGKDGEPPEVTRGNTGLWARFAVAAALGDIPGETPVSATALAGLFSGELGTMTVYALFGLPGPDPAALRRRATGSLLHLVQDSHAHGHTERNARGEIVEFHSYTGQDHDEHGEFDDFHGGDGVDSVPGGPQAIDHGVRVLELLQRGDAEAVIAYVMDEVLRLAPDVRPAGAGENLRKRPSVDLDHVAPPEGFELTHRDATEGGMEFRARLPAADGRLVTLNLQLTSDPQRGLSWILWKEGTSALASGSGFPTTQRLYLDINPALGYPAGTLPRR